MSDQEPAHAFDPGTGTDPGTGADPHTSEGSAGERPVRTGVAALLAQRDGVPDPRRYRRVLEGFIGVPATDGNEVDALRNGDEIFPAMLEAIRGASRSIDFLTYVYWTGDVTRTFAEALAERARAGVRVRVLLDSFGTRQMDDDLVTRLEQAGAEVEHFRPYASWQVWKYNLRTHRRVLVCDEEIAFTGGAGIAEEWTGDARGPHEWRDTHYRVRGPAVDGVHAAFLSDWLQTPNPVFDPDHDHFPERPRDGSMPVQAVRGSSQPGWNDVALAMRALMDLASTRIRITSAYFRPPRHFIDLLCDIAGRGVQVQVLVPGPHAEPKVARWISEDMYDPLLAGGVELWRYQPSMHHAKIITVDSLVALVGTANFDSRSVALNEQVGLIVHDAGFVGTLDEHFDEDLAESRRIDPDAWAQRGRAQRMRERAMHLLSYGIRGGGAGRS